MKYFKKETSMFLAAIVFLLVMSFGVEVQGAGKKVSESEETNKECNLKIEGMTCIMCEAMIKKALKDSTLTTEIDHKAGTGKVTYLEGKTTCASVVDKINKTGFKAVIVEKSL